MDIQKLISMAIQIRQNSYSPYSNFAVGAALITTDNTIFTGCNIENSSFSPTICAEQTAIFKAISDGYKTFKAIAIVGGPKNIELVNLCPPCGVCRQVISEFCNDDFQIILATSEIDYKIYTFADLLPIRFDKKLI